VRGHPRRVLVVVVVGREHRLSSERTKCPRNFSHRAWRVWIRCCRDTDTRTVVFHTMSSRLTPVMIQYALAANEFNRRI